MRTIIINGSPKGNSKKCNSMFFAREFVRNMENPCEIQCVANQDAKELAQYIKPFDTVLFILPLYIHAMPGILMDFIEFLEPTKDKSKSMGFIVQAGFIETSQERFLKAYFEGLTARLNYRYLGTVAKGEAAGIYMYPKMFKKVFRQLNRLGVEFERNHAFDRDIVKKMEKPYKLSKPMLILLTIVDKFGLANIGWHKKLKENNAFDKRLEKPFL